MPSRRLSRHEYEHTLHDLLGIGGEIAKYLPPEDESGVFDVLAANQEMSSVHVKGFLKAAEAALDEAIELGPKPKMKRKLDYANSRYMQMWFERLVRRVVVAQFFETMMISSCSVVKTTTCARMQMACNFLVDVDRHPHH